VDDKDIHKFYHVIQKEQNIGVDGGIILKWILNCMV